MRAQHLLLALDTGWFFTTRVVHQSDMKIEISSCGDEGLQAKSSSLAASFFILQEWEVYILHLEHYDHAMVRIALKQIDDAYSGSRNDNFTCESK